RASGPPLARHPGRSPRADPFIADTAFAIERRNRRPRSCDPEREAETATGVTPGRSTTRIDRPNALVDRCPGDRDDANERLRSEIDPANLEMALCRRSGSARPRW